MEKDRRPHRRNNFDTLRIIAAISVLVSHSFPLALGKGWPQPLHALSREQTDLGSFAVLVFFAISGYLITQSFDRTPRPGRFLKARCLRIFPALFVTAAAAALILGPVVTSLPPSSYFARRDWISYVLGNSLLVHMHYALPGVFENNPYPSAVNGSIWTLQYEFLMYFVVLGLGVSRLLRPKVVLAVLVTVLLLEWRWLGGNYALFGGPFAGGAALYLWRDRVPLDWRLAALSAVLLVVGLVIGGFRIAFALFGTYLVIYLALARSVRLPNLARWGDLSYGVYVFAFPIEQTLSYLFAPGLTWYAEVLIALPIALGLAALSWRFVEKPALRLKGAASSQPAAPAFTGSGAGGMPRRRA